MSEVKAILVAAESAVLEAGEKIKPLFGRVMGVKAKESPTDLYSDADLLAEETIFAALAKKFPKFNYRSEEREFIDRGSEYCWVVDPLDGSTAFIAGLDYWGISIGLLKGKKAVVGVIYIPAKDWLFRAGRGKGSWLNGKKMRVSKQGVMDKAMVGFDVGHRGYRAKDMVQNIVPLVDRVRYMPSFACSTFGQSLVALGTYDAYLHHRAYIWDFCAGSIIVEEAGGRVTDQRGKALDWSKVENMSMVCSNGLIHDKVLELMGIRDWMGDGKIGG